MCFQPLVAPRRNYAIWTKYTLYYVGLGNVGTCKEFPVGYSFRAPSADLPPASRR